MKVTLRLLFSLYIGFMAASTAYFFYGPSGYVAFLALEEEAVRLEKNLDELRQIHNRLATEFDSLRRSSDTVALIARDLGYLRENEMLIDLEGNRPRTKSYAVGRMVTPQQVYVARRSISLMSGLLATVCTFILVAGIFPVPRRN